MSGGRRASIILGLSALAIAQPLLGLFGDHPEFFVAGNYSSSQIVLFAVLVTVVPPAIGIALTTLAAAIDRRLGDVVFAGVVVVLGAAFALALLRTIGLDHAAIAVVIALAAGAGLAVLVVRARPARLLLSYLAVANLFFLASFLFLSRSSELVAGASSVDTGSVEVPRPDGPVVVLVLDEMPAATIMRADGSLNADRYPGFADLASVSTWFRNASSQYNLTHRAVPSLLDGTLAEDDALPTAADHPRSLFTLLGGVVPVRRYESVTDLCPPEVCAPPPRQPLGQALEDASIVYGHRVLPGALRDDLPAIDNSWGSFGAADDPDDPDEPDRPDEPGDERDADADTLVGRAYAKWQGLDADERSPLGQAGILRDEIAAIGAEPSLHVVHVALPHRPWNLSATGTTLTFEPELITDPGAPGYDFAARMEYQLHSMQTGAADTLVGELVTHLRSLPTWEDTTLVVTSDHGTNLTPPDIGRMTVTDANREEVYRIPLFVKAPGQVEGAVDDASAQSLDVLPSVIDLLGAEVDWDLDGHSLYDGSEATTAPKVSEDVAVVLDIATRRARQFGGDDWLGLAATGAAEDLAGRRVEDLTVGERSTWAARLDDAGVFADLPTADGGVPLVLAGSVDRRGDTEPPELVAAIDGRIAGVVGGYRPAGRRWAFTGYVADLYRDGANTVELYEVERDGDTVTLRRAT